jgi:hypothetical protein
LVHVAHMEAVRHLGSVEAVQRISTAKMVLGYASSDRAKAGYRYVAEINACTQNVDAERGSSSGEDSAVAMETKGRSLRDITITSVSSQSGDPLSRKKTEVKPTSGDPTATLVLGLLEMKGEGFFRRAPRQDQITWVCRSYGLGSNVDADSNVGAIVLTVGDVSRGADFQRAVYSRVLVNGEGHGARRAWWLLLILGNRRPGRDRESERILVDGGNLSRHGLRLWGSLLTLLSLLRVGRR